MPTFLINQLRDITRDSPPCLPVPGPNPGIQVAWADTRHKEQGVLVGVRGQTLPVLPAGPMREPIRGKVGVEAVEAGLLDVVPMLELHQQGQEDHRGHRHHPEHPVQRWVATHSQIA